MKKVLTLLFLLISLIGCSTETIESITIHKMKNFSEVNKEWEFVITDKNDIELFNTAFKSAKKLPGIVDMADPHYKVFLGEETYFLWISKDSGTIMNTVDTHTIYSLSKSNSIKIYGLLDEK
ncbi:hypothetical protein [Fredinandcohnia sp. 179-A 10B2 NHS]|uniref:hypothetical protein n=1 Tax=Fredinandcohnia sp. 179-A 10B2 NHS TaxID=3235176 RepID=UPI0039A06C43